MFSILHSGQSGRILGFVAPGGNRGRAFAICGSPGRHRLQFGPDGFSPHLDRVNRPFWKDEVYRLAKHLLTNP